MKKLIVIFALCSLPASAWANACSSNATGNWNSNSTWTSCGGVYPGNGDTVTINTGHTVTCPDGVTCVVGTSPAAGGTVALTLIGNLVVGGGSSGVLQLQGPVNGTSTTAIGALTLNAGSTLDFYPCLASSPGTATYAWSEDGYSQGNRLITANGTSSAHVTIKTDSCSGSAGHGYFSTASSYSDSMWWNATYTDFIGIGDSTNYAISFNHASNTGVEAILKHSTFDSTSGGITFLNSVPLAGGWDFEDNQFLQWGNVKWTGANRFGVIFKTASGTPTGNRILKRCYFLLPPQLFGLTDIEDNVFMNGLNASGATPNWGTFSGNLVRMTSQPETVVGGNVTGSFMLTDAGAGVFDSGTATSGASATLTDSTKAWASGAWATYTVKIASGTGAGQFRAITSNTATALTITPAWATIPDSTSVYQITASLDSGTVTGSGTATLTDSSKTWTTNILGAASGNFSSLVEITSGAGVGQRRLIVSNTGTQLTVAYRWDTAPSAGDSYIILQDIYNNHGIGPSSAITSGSISFTGNVFQNAGCDTQGDMLLHFSVTSLTLYSITQNILLPNCMGDSSGTPFTVGGNPTYTDSGPYQIEHNTWFIGDQGLAFSEGGTNPTGTITSLRGNIAWNDPTRTSNTTVGSCANSSGYCWHGGENGPYLALDESHASCTGNNADIICTNSGSCSTSGSTSMADYNTSWGMKAGCSGTLPNYSVQATVAPGSHDVNVNPTFVDSTRTFWSWATTAACGSISTTRSGQIADGLNCLKGTPTLTRTSLIPYIQAGFVPQNSALATAAFDGTTIGAVAYAAPTGSGSTPMVHSAVVF
jgi:hypothetical protein